MNNYENKPTQREERWLSQDIMKSKILKQNWITIKKDYIESDKTYLSFWDQTFELIFYNINQVTKVETFPDKYNHDVFFENVYVLD